MRKLSVTPRNAMEVLLGRHCHTHITILDGLAGEPVPETGAEQSRGFMVYAASYLWVKMESCPIYTDEFSLKKQ